MSLAARLLNVFATPSEVFNDVKTAPASTANWLLPGVLSALVAVLLAIIIFSQPAIRQQVHEQQAKAMDKQVQSGRVPREKADQALEWLEKLTVPGAILSAVIFSLLRVIWWALVLWLLGRWFLKVQFPFIKTLEVAGLASMIIVLGTVVTVLLTVNLAKMFATPSLGLLVTDFDATRKSHLMLGAANIFSVWLVGVMSVGLARLASVPFLRAAWFVFAYWVAQQFFFIFSGLGQFAL